MCWWHPQELWNFNHCFLSCTLSLCIWSVMLISLIPTSPLISLFLFFQVWHIESDPVCPNPPSFKAYPVGRSTTLCLFHHPCLLLHQLLGIWPTDFLTFPREGEQQGSLANGLCSDTAQVQNHYFHQLGKLFNLSELRFLIYKTATTTTTNSTYHIRLL